MHQGSNMCTHATPPQHSCNPTQATHRMLQPCVGLSTASQRSMNCSTHCLNLSQINTTLSRTMTATSPSDWPLKRQYVGCIPTTRPAPSCLMHLSKAVSCISCSQAAQHPYCTAVKQLGDSKASNKQHLARKSCHAIHLLDYAFCLSASQHVQDCSVPPGRNPNHHTG